VARTFDGKTGTRGRVREIAFAQVSDVMTRSVITATPETPLGEIATLQERAYDTAKVDGNSHSA
jgi:CBS domain-containing protein